MTGKKVSKKYAAEHPQETMELKGRYYLSNLKESFERTYESPLNNYRGHALLETNGAAGYLVNATRATKDYLFEHYGLLTQFDPSYKWSGGHVLSGRINETLVS